jgi:arginine deiminase
LGSFVSCGIVRFYFLQNLQNDVHYLAEQVSEATNSINQLRQELREELIEAVAAKFDQVVELTNAVNWLKDRLACQPPSSGIYFSLFYEKIFFKILFLLSEL